MKMFHIYIFNFIIFKMSKFERLVSIVDILDFRVKISFSDSKIKFLKFS